CPGARAEAPSPLEALGDELTHVLDGQRVLGALHLAAEVDHGQAERAGRAHHVDLGLERFLDANQVHALLGLHFHPHVTAAAAAADAALAIPRHLDDSQPRAGLGALPRPPGNAVVPPAIARAEE